MVLRKLLAFVVLFAGILTPTIAFAQFTTVQGGTGTTSPSGILIGVTGNLHLQTLTVGTGLTLTGTTLAATGGGGTPGGLNTQIQYNNNGSFGGISGAVTDGTAVSLTAAHLFNPTINGAGTGLATLTYPNTSSNATITFPTVTGTLALTSQLTGGNVATSSSETSGYFPTWTTTSGTPAKLSGTSLIFSNGTQVGINNASPSQTLDVNGNIRASTALIAASSFISSYFPEAANLQTFFNNSSQAIMTLNGVNNNVGVGTTSPYAQLSIATPNGATGSQTTLFAIASSTSNSTTTLFAISNTGTVTLTPTGTNASFNTSSGGLTLGAFTGQIFLGSSGALGTRSSIDLGLASNAFITWTNGANNFSSATIDLGLSRIAAGVLSVDTGTNGNSLGTLIAGALGIGTTSTYALLSIVATSTTGVGAPTTLFAIASTTGGTSTSTLFSISNTGSIFTTLANGCVQAASGILTSTGVACGSGGGGSAGYPFPLTGNATSTLTQFNGGLTAYGTSTIGDGTAAGGLAISGNSTTTLNGYIGGILGIGTVPTTTVGLDIVGDVREANTHTDATNKAFRFRDPNFTNSQNDFLLAFGQSKSTGNTLIFGGGQAGFTAASSIAFFAGTGNNTDTGTSEVSITTGGVSITTLGTGIVKATAGLLSIATPGTDYSNFGYLFPGNATSTLLSFTGGLSSASTTLTGPFVFANATGTNATTTNLDISGTATIGSLSGLLKATSGVVTTGTNGTDYTLLTANTCSAGQFFNSATAAGVLGCGTPTGGSSFGYPFVGDATTTALTLPLANATGLPLTTGVTGVLPIANGGTNVGSQTSSGVNYFDGTKITSGTVLGFDGSNNLSINSTAPHLILGTATNVTTAASIQTTVSGGTVPNSVIAYNYSNTATAASSFAGLRSRGTQAVPAVVQAGDILALFVGRGKINTTVNSWPTTGNATIAMVAAENFSATNEGASIGFSTTPIGTINTVQAMILDSTGNLGIGTSTPYAKLSVSDNTQSPQLVAFAIASSTATATSTLFSISNIGSTTLFRIPSSLLKTDSSGTIIAAVAGTDYLTSASIPAYAFPVNDTNFGNNANATSSIVSFASGIVASSTSQFSNASTSLFTVTNSQWIIPLATAAGTFLAVDFNGQVIATTSPVGGGSGTVGNGVAGQVGFYSANSTSVAGSFMGYASSSNKTTAFGFGSGGQSATTSNSNIQNSSFGHLALNAFSGGIFSDDSAFGAFAGQKVTTGSNNTALGAASLFTATTSGGNTAVGHSALSGAGSGTWSSVGNNTAIGESALSVLTTGDTNVALGSNALTSDSTGRRNIGIGNYAGRDISTGYDNIVIGQQNSAGGTSQTGGGNILIGFQPNPPSATGNLQLAIGNLLFGILPATSTVTSFTLPTSGTIGIGTTSPFAKLSVHLNNGDTTLAAFAVGSSTASATTTLFQIDNVGHFTYKAASSSCGTGCANIVGNDDGGTITTGTLASAVTVNFGSPWSAAPTCTESDNSTTVTGDISSVSTTAFTISFSAGLTGTIYYQCALYK